MAESVNDNQTPKKKRETADDRVNFRCRQPIKAELERLAAAHNMGLSEYLIACGLNKKLPSAPATAERQIFVKALGELGKIGSNLNQLARWANQGQDVELIEIKDAAQAVTRCADEIRFSLTGYRPANDNP